MKIEYGQVITQIISFIIMLWVLKRFAWKPILKTLEDRRNGIKAELRDIEQQGVEIDKIKGEYLDKIKEIDTFAKGKTKEAIDEGQAIADQIKHQAHNEAKEIINKAREDLEKEIVKAKKQLKDEIVDLTVMATEKVLGSKMDQAAQKDMIRQFIDEAEKK